MLNEEPIVFVVDDDALFLEAWESQSGFIWKTYTSPEEFRQALEKDTKLLGSLSCIITDFKFPGSENGLQFARWLREVNFKKPIFLASDRPFKPKEVEAVISKVITKDAKNGLAMIVDHFKKDGV